MQWYLGALKKYFVFSGRARRTEFWMFVLVNVVVVALLRVIDSLLGWESGGGDSSMGAGDLMWGFSVGAGALSSIYGLAVLIPSIAVGVRRLHDTGRVGWWWFINFVPCVGWIVYLIFMLLPGEPEANRFGDDPKAMAPPSDPSPEQ